MKHWHRVNHKRPTGLICANCGAELLGDEDECPYCACPKADCA